MSTALLPVTLSMLCAGMAGIFLVLGVLALGGYALNKFFSGKQKSFSEWRSSTYRGGHCSPLLFYILQVYSFATNTTPTTPGPTWVPMVGPSWATRPPVSWRFWCM